MHIRHLSLTLLLIPGLAIATQQTPGEFDRPNRSSSSAIGQVPSVNILQGNASQASSSPFVIPVGDKELVRHLKDMHYPNARSQELLEILANVPDEHYLDKAEQLLIAGIKMGLFGGEHGGLKIQNLLRLALHKGSNEILALVTEMFASVPPTHTFLDTRIFFNPNEFWGTRLSIDDYFKYILASEVQSGRKLGLLLLHTSQSNDKSVVYSMAKKLLVHLKEDPKRMLILQLHDFINMQPVHQSMTRAQIVRDLGQQNIIPDLANIVANYAIPQMPADVAADILAIPAPTFEEFTEQPITVGMTAPTTGHEWQRPEPRLLAYHFRKRATEEKKNQE